GYRAVKLGGGLGGAGGGRHGVHVDRHQRGDLNVAIVLDVAADGVDRDVVAVGDGVHVRGLHHASRRAVADGLRVGGRVEPGDAVDLALVGDVEVDRGDVRGHRRDVGAAALQEDIGLSLGAGGEGFQRVSQVYRGGGQDIAAVAERAADRIEIHVDADG